MLAELLPDALKGCWKVIKGAEKVRHPEGSPRMRGVGGTLRFLVNDRVFPSCANLRHLRLKGFALAVGGANGRFPSIYNRESMRTTSTILIGICIVLAVSNSPIPAQQKEDMKTQHATGTFEVKLTPQPLGGQSDPNDKSIGRMSGEKQFHGDLEGTSKVEMLTAGSPEKGSAGYVAMEPVTGTLKGRSGTFVLQHSGTMNHGAQELSITVVPASGTGQLAGLAGKMTINIVNGKHSYDFEYTLPETQGSK